MLIVDSTVSDQGCKLLIWLNLSTSQIKVEQVAATVHDNGDELAHTDLPAGALKLGDLSFFDLDTFERCNEQACSGFRVIKPLLTVGASSESELSEIEQAILRISLRL